MTSLTDEENESYENHKFCYTCKKKDLLTIIKK